MTQLKITRPLIERIKRQIRLEGPLGIAEYMSTCLSDPEAGYYTTGTPFGRQGDFITAPEISQMFGELIGIWCVSMWRHMGKPRHFNLVELGPGRGVLIADLLRASTIDDEFISAVEVVLVEISDPLRKQQKKALASLNVKVSWLDEVQNIAAVPTIFIGNEFLDALPFRQYVKSANRWKERVVDIQNDELCFSTGYGFFDPRDLPKDHRLQSDGTIFEVSPSREAIVDFIADHLAENNGAALLIDYGHLEPGFGDTFQAVANHSYVDPLRNPGKADLTSHVDFSHFAIFFEGKGQCKLITQADFLLNLGLLERAGILGSGRSIDEQRNLEQAVKRLAGDKEMGTLFKVLIASSIGVELAGV